MLEAPLVEPEVVRAQLRDLAARSDQLRKRMIRAAESDVISVTFNAWQFEDATQIWAGLAETITARLEQTLSRPARLWARLSYAWRKRRAELIEELVLPGVVAVSAVAVLAVFGSALLEEWADSGRASNNSKGSPRTLQS